MAFFQVIADIQRGATSDTSVAYSALSTDLTYSGISQSASSQQAFQTLKQDLNSGNSGAAQQALQQFLSEASVQESHLLMGLSA
jgi:hypothetical protein